MARVSAARFSAVSVGAMLPTSLLLVSPFTQHRGYMLRFFVHWCRGDAAHFTAVGAAFYTAARVNVARFWAVGVGAMLPILLLLVPPVTQRRG